MDANDSADAAHSASLAYPLAHQSFGLPWPIVGAKGMSIIQFMRFPVRTPLTCSPVTPSYSQGRPTRVLDAAMLHTYLTIGPFLVLCRLIYRLGARWQPADCVQYRSSSI